MDDKKGSVDKKQPDTPIDSNPAPDVGFPDDHATAATRAVAFPDAEDEKSHARRPPGVSMKREITQEDRELAQAGYEHLDEEKAKQGGQRDLGNVDIVEHKLALTDLEVELKTSFDTKEPESSEGLSSQQAKERLAKDGPNILTPPKKKSALRKVCSGSLA